MTEHAHLARSCPGQLSIVLISGDEDFLEGVQGALAAGFSVELVTHDTASGALLAQVRNVSRVEGGGRAGRRERPNNKAGDVDSRSVIVCEG